LAFDDKVLAINWPVATEQLSLSIKDTQQPTLDNAELFDYGQSLYV
jgi:dTDP-4-dehydrorhamnose 3,5-epimerase-like enzyme